MLKQIVKGEKYIPVKYHGQVKLVVFECNNCHKEFEKPESYFRKQLKTRRFACCFCSPGCRSTYYSRNNVTGMKKIETVSSPAITKEDVMVEGTPTTLTGMQTPAPPKETEEITQVKKHGFFDSFKKLFS